jgi:hypothetical protein
MTSIFSPSTDARARPSVVLLTVVDERLSPRSLCITEFQGIGKTTSAMSATQERN